MISQYTKLLIQTIPNVHAAAIGPMPNRKFGIYIGMYDETPSDFKRPVVLLTSDGVFDTPEEAKEQGDFVIENIRKGNLDDNQKS